MSGSNQNVPDSKDDRSSEAESVSSRGNLASRLRRAAAGPGEGRTRTRSRTNSQIQRATRRAQPAALATPRRVKGKMETNNRASSTSTCSVCFQAILRPSRNSRQVAKVWLCATSRLGNSPVRPGMWSVPDRRMGPEPSAATGSAEINLCEAPQHPAWDCDGEQLKRLRNELACGSKPLGPRSRDK